MKRFVLRLLSSQRCSCSSCPRAAWRQPPVLSIQKSLIQKEFPLGDPIQLAEIVVMVGPVPVVLIPVLTFQVGIDGSVHVGIVTRWNRC